MASMALLAILGLGMGVGYTLVLRRLTEQLVLKSNPVIGLAIWMATIRFAQIGLLAAVGVVWSVGLALAALGGFWLGRTAVLALSLSRKFR